MKIAKIALSADTKQFQAEIEEAKKAISGLGNAKISPNAEKSLANIFSVKLNQSARRVQQQIDSVSTSLERLTKGASFDTTKAEQYGRTLDSLKSRLNDLNKLQKQVGEGKFPAPSSEDVPGAAPAGGGMLKGLGRAGLGLLGGMGIMSLLGRRNQMAGENLDIRSLTRGGNTIGAGLGNSMGFTEEESRQRAFDMAKAAGGVGAGGLEQLTQMGMVAQRAYGVTADQSSGLVGAARKAGVSGSDEQAKFLSNTIGTAVAVGLEGSKIGEYLSSMTGYLAEIGRGVNIDTASLQGFAGALGSMPFFKNDPSRIFDALKDIGGAFQSGDLYQQSRGTQAMLAVAPGSSPASTEMRRKLGLFGEVKDQGLVDRMEKNYGMDMRLFRPGSGKKIASEFINKNFEATKGMGNWDRLSDMASGLGLKSPEAAMSIFDAKQQGKGLSDKDFEKIRKANMSPEERTASVMDSVDGGIRKTAATLSTIHDQIATNIAVPLNAIATTVAQIASYLGIGTKVAAGVGAAGVVGATAYGIMGAQGTAAAAGAAGTAATAALVAGDAALASAATGAAGAAGALEAAVLALGGGAAAVTAAFATAAAAIGLGGSVAFKYIAGGGKRSLEEDVSSAWNYMTGPADTGPKRSIFEEDHPASSVLPAGPNNVLPFRSPTAPYDPAASAAGQSIDTSTLEGYLAESLAVQKETAANTRGRGTASAGGGGGDRRPSGSTTKPAFQYRSGK